MQDIVILVVLVLLGLFVFYIYFCIKVLGFYLNATRLYREMIRRQDATMRLLVDIRDNTKKEDISQIALAETGPSRESWAIEPTAERQEIPRTPSM